MEELVKYSILIFAALFFFIETMSILVYAYIIAKKIMNKEYFKLKQSFDFKSRIELVLYILSAIIFFTGGK